MLRSWSKGRAPKPRYPPAARRICRLAFPVGACSRTILGKIEVVIWRTDKQSFRVECWRSFSTYAFDFLEDAAQDAALTA
jgi:heterotetrameric sarcosine oxidase gamma subunit